MTLNKKNERCNLPPPKTLLRFLDLQQRAVS